MNEWASKLLSVFPDRTKTDFDQFITEVNNDQAEYMYYNVRFLSLSKLHDSNSFEFDFCLITERIR